MAGKTEYKNKFASEKYDRVGLMLPKGEKEAVRTHAQNHGESINGFVIRAIHETIERDNKNEGAENE